MLVNSESSTADFRKFSTKRPSVETRLFLLVTLDSLEILRPKAQLLAIKCSLEVIYGEDVFKSSGEFSSKSGKTIINENFRFPFSSTTELKARLTKKSLFSTAASQVLSFEQTSTEPLLLKPKDAVVPLRLELPLKNVFGAVEALLCLTLQIKNDTDHKQPLAAPLPESPEKKSKSKSVLLVEDR